MTCVRLTVLALLLTGAGACSVPGPGEAVDGIHDPYEARNRKAHAFNVKVDEKALRKAGQGYVAVVPDEVQTTVSNFADTLSLPRTVVNQTLQGRLDDAVRNSLRFVVNATLGFAGMYDMASDMGIGPDSSDFGETLAVWGVKEGAYLELPLIGPSTERDAAGKLVDLFTNPLSYVIPVPERHVVTVAKAADGVGRRGQFSDTVDSILYESADSYAQLRVIYLQNRRHALGEDAPGGEIDLGLDTEGF